MSVHLVVLIHGLYGSPANLSTVQEELVKAGQIDGKAGELETVVHVCKSFTGSHTWDGVDINAQKASMEIDQLIEQLAEVGRSVDYVSVMGYSLGGLVARYLVGLLHARTPSFFDTHKPASFSTAATPHLGVLKYGTRANAIVHTIGRRLFSRSGQQLYCLDKDEDGQCLLEVLADPRHIFVRALQTFPTVVIVANGCHDLTVPYPTASFSLSDPFEAFEKTGVAVEVDEDNVVKSWHFPARSIGETLVKNRGGRRRPWLPPFLILPFPFTYLLFLLLPFVLPLWLCFVSSVLVLHTIQARRRHQARTLETAETTTSSSTTPLLTPQSSHPRLESLKALSIDTPFVPPSPSIRSNASTPPLADLDPDLPSDVAPREGQVALHLTAAQKRMSRNLETSLPQAERIVAWFPWAFNSHALLVARDVKRFKWHEEGRGVVRQLARIIVNSPPRGEPTT